MMSIASISTIVPDKTEAELISELKGGSLKAFDAIYALYARRLYAFCLRYTKQRETAEEIMEDAFLWIWNNRAKLRQEETLRHIIFLRTKHLLINAYRRVVNSPVYEDYMDHLDRQQASGATDGMMEYDDFVAQLNAALSRLPARQRQIISLAKLDMLTNKEIAARLGYSEQTVKNQLSLGLKQLRAMMASSLGMLWAVFLV